MGTEETMEINKITEKIIACAIDVHKEHGCGFLESVYQSALAKEVGLIINFNTLKVTNGIKRLVNNYQEDSAISASSAVIK